MSLLHFGHGRFYFILYVLEHINFDLLFVRKSESPNIHFLTEKKHQWNSNNFLLASEHNWLIYTLLRFLQNKCSCDRTSFCFNVKIFQSAYGISKLLNIPICTLFSIELDHPHALSQTFVLFVWVSYPCCKSTQSQSSLSYRSHIVERNHSNARMRMGCAIKWSRITVFVHSMLWYGFLMLSSRIELIPHMRRFRCRIIIDSIK